MTSRCVSLFCFSQSRVLSSVFIPSMLLVCESCACFSPRHAENPLKSVPLHGFMSVICFFILAAACVQPKRIVPLCVLSGNLSYTCKMCFSIFILMYTAHLNSLKIEWEKVSASVCFSANECLPTLLNSNTQLVCSPGLYLWHVVCVHLQMMPLNKTHPPFSTGERHSAVLTVVVLRIVAEAQLFLQGAQESTQILCKMFLHEQKFLKHMPSVSMTLFLFVKSWAWSHHFSSSFQKN